MNSAATTLSSWAFAIDRTLRHHYGLEPQALFASLGIETDRLNDLTYRIPVVQMTQLWRKAVLLTGDACIGLRVAEHVSPTTFHALGYMAIASKNLMEAISRVIQHANSISDVAQLALDMRGEALWLKFALCEGSPDVADEALDAFLAAMVFVARNYIQIEPPLQAVYLRRARPVNDHRFSEFFRTPVFFGSECTAFVCERKYVLDLLPTYNPALANANEKLLAEYREQRGTLRLQEQVVQWIENSFPAEPQQELLAQYLNMSVRKLQRKLAEENAHFQSLLDATRERLAQQWLKEGAKSIQQIADALGFANPSAFTRAFKRWCGQAPELFRKTHLPPKN